MKEVLLPALYIGILGGIFGAILAVASRVFAIKVDERITKVEEALPGANCGACGYPGCSGFAKAVVEGKAPITGCVPGGSAVADKIGEIMGMKSQKGSVRKIAKVKCLGGHDKAKWSAEYEGLQDCNAAALVHGGGKVCIYGCLGLGSCAAVCPFGAITMSAEGLPVIDSEKCTGCGLCVKECPRNILELIPINKVVHVACMSQDLGKDARLYCDVSCIACKICEKVCPVEVEVDGEKRKAIKVENNVAKIDYNLCISCGKCVEKCPRHIIYSFREHKKVVAEIDQEKCVKCNICQKNCQFDAIEGKIKEEHRIIKDKCVSCGVCIEKCPKDAINFVPRT
jgi:electron transport complex protein RnfB